MVLWGFFKILALQDRKNKQVETLKDNLIIDQK